MDAWNIEWFICRRDASDVAYELSIGNPDAKVGDELWRVPKSIGPLEVSHDHWAGYHIDCEEKDARLAAAAPLMYEALQEMIADYDAAFLSDPEEFIMRHMPQVKAALASAGGE